MVGFELEVTKMEFKFSNYKLNKSLAKLFIIMTSNNISNTFIFKLLRKKTVSQLR